jgi:tetratricopeptide (TPR) repeat protein
MDRPYLRVWDLRAIRQRLAELRLDWEAPATFGTPDAPGCFPPIPKPFHVDQGQLDSWKTAYLAALRAAEARRVADELRCQGDLAGALAAVQKAQALMPEDAELNHYLAYMLSICPEPKMRDARRAVGLATKAIDAVPNPWYGYWRALGMAQHFAGDDREAVKALTRSLELDRSGDGFDFFLMAAVHQKLGNKEQARRWYEQGVTWMAANRHPYMAEPSILRANAEALLGIEQPSKR